MPGSASGGIDPTTISGDAGNDVIRVEASVTFDWVPDPGSQYVDVQTSYGYYDDGTPYAIETHTSGLSSANGTMTFQGVSSSEAFQLIPADIDFQFTAFGPFNPGPHQWSGGFSWDPSTGMLQGGIDESLANSTLDGYASDQGYFDALNGSNGELRVEYGHWTLAPDPRNVDVFGGAGNDTIYGGQGDELLSGDDGNDVLWAGLGIDTVLGGAGGDVLHGGTGAQILDGGAGNDTIYAGSGAQVLMGGGGRDLLQAGTGKQTVLGGVGNDTIHGGMGAQVLMGGDGNDYIRAGSGNQTLLGGAGHDVFALSNGTYGQTVIGDFTPGQDRIGVARGLHGLMLNTVHDLATHVSSDVRGDAVLDLGAGTTVTLTGLSAHQVETHLANWFTVV